MQKLNAIAAFAVAFALTVFAVTFWLNDGAPFRSAGTDAEMNRRAAPVINSTEPVRLNRLGQQDG